MLGERLLASGIISPTQLQAALDEQRNTGDLLGDVLLKLSFVGEETLSKALAEEADVPFVRVNGARPDPSLIALVPESFARRHLLVLLRFHDAAIEVLQANPFDVLAIDEVQRVAGYPAKVMCGTRSDVLRLIERSYTEQKNVQARSDRPDVAAQFENLLNDAITQGATDMHIEPEAQRVGLRYRLDGVLVAVDDWPIELHGPVVSRIKALAELDPAQHDLPQDGRFSHDANGRMVDLRVNILPTTYGEKVALRILERRKLAHGLDDLGLSRRNLALLREMLGQPCGIVLVSGPSGAGKTTTLYSALTDLSQRAAAGLSAGRGRNILTIEDPVECEVDGVRQTQLKPKAAFTFETAIQSILRQDPDVIMVGELSDLHTTQLAWRAASSGVLLLSSLSALDVASVAPRLIEMGLEPHSISSALIGIVGQRLIRLICPDCRTPTTYPAHVLAKVGLTPDPGFVLYRGNGCDACGGRGYRGRTGVFEVLKVTPDIQAMIRDRADAGLIRSAAAAAGTRTLFEQALTKAILGQTTIEEALELAR